MNASRQAKRFNHCSCRDDDNRGISRRGLSQPPGRGPEREELHTKGRHNPKESA